MMESGNNQSKTNEALRQFADLIIERLEHIKESDWQKGWLPTKGAGFPSNLNGRSYSCSNALFLYFVSMKKEYNTPLFLTFNQAKEIDLRINKGEKSFPVSYWNISIKDSEGNKLSPDEFKKLSDEEKEQCTVRPFLKTYPVFNIDQTDFKTKHPDKYQSLLEKYKPEILKDTTGMYTNAAIDRMIDKQEWVCPIYANQPSDSAFYSVSKDFITIPMKSQFKKVESPEALKLVNIEYIATQINEEKLYNAGMEYYATLLHEMSHSTMTEGRLKRSNKAKTFGDDAYAKEELVAELTAALTGRTMGFDKKITDNSVAYVDHWIKALKEEPQFIVSLMSDINKASDMILSYIDRQRMALGQEPYVTKNNPEIKESQTVEIENRKERLEETIKASRTEFTQDKAIYKNQMSQRVNFKELKQLVGVEDIAFQLGYRVDKKAGVGRYIEMYNPQTDDKLIIRNTQDKSAQTFFRRDGSKGDVITLIRENINSFNVTGRNEWDIVSKVMSQSANMPVIDRSDEYEQIKNAQEHKTFDPGRYEVRDIDMNNVPKLLHQRGFDKQTIETFRPFVTLIRDTNNKNYSGYNIGFPYTSEQGAAGYEIRGHGGFKSKAAGTDSSNALWVADFTKGCNKMARNVYLFESAFDAMAFHQMNRSTLGQDVALVSLGGTFSDKQIMNVQRTFPNARLNDCFDNDIAGRVNALRLISITQKMQLSVVKADDRIEATLNNVKVTIDPQKSTLEQVKHILPDNHNLGEHTPGKQFKDWNDCLQMKPIETKISPSKYERDENLARQRKSAFKL